MKKGRPTMTIEITIEGPKGHKITKKDERTGEQAALKLGAAMAEVIGRGASTKGVVRVLHTNNNPTPWTRPRRQKSFQT